MQDILDATGLKKGGIYRHFDSKEELAAEAFRYSLSRATKLRTPTADPRMTAPQSLRQVIGQFIEEPSPVSGGCPILNTAVDTDDGNPRLRELARGGLKDWRLRIARIVREGIAHKEIRKDVEPRALANTIIATLEGALMISRLEGAKTALKDVRAFLEDRIEQIAIVR